MTKINFLIISLIFYSFIFLSLNKIYGANEQLVCPGLKLFNRWCAGEHLENNIKACIMVTKPTKEDVRKIIIWIYIFKSIIIIF